MVKPSAHNGFNGGSTPSPPTINEGHNGKDSLGNQDTGKKLWSF